MTTPPQQPSNQPAPGQPQYGQPQQDQPQQGQPQQGQPQGQSPPGQPAPAPDSANGPNADHVTVDIGSDAKKVFLIGTPLCLVLGGAVLYSSFNGNMENASSSTTTTGIVIGGAFFLVGLLFLLSWKQVSRPRQLMLNTHGMTWHDPKRTSWSVRWDELAEVQLPVSQKTKADPNMPMRGRMRATLMFYPGDLGFRQRHPEMEGLWEFPGVENGYGLFLGHSPETIRSVDGALRRFCPRLCSTTDE